MLKPHYQPQNIRLLLCQINNRNQTEVATLRQKIHRDRINNILNFICDILIIIGCIFGVLSAGGIMLFSKLSTVNLAIVTLLVIIFAIGIGVGIYDYEHSTKRWIDVNHTLTTTLDLLLTTNDPNKRKAAIESFIALIK